MESSHEIRDILRNDGTKMLFITAGMGGGTGTGAAPVIAQIAKELDILTVGIVTLPFDFEGKSKLSKAMDGIEELKKGCDSVITILNQRLIEIYGDLSQSKAFEKADDIIATSAKCIAEIVTVPGQINVDFEDVKTVMKDAGTSVLGSAEASGTDRAEIAINNALTSPLLNNTNISGAKKILLNIVSGGGDNELSTLELNTITKLANKSSSENVTSIVSSNKLTLTRFKLIVCPFFTPVSTVLTQDEQVIPSTRYFALNVLATQYYQILREHDGDQVVANQVFNNLFGYDPTALLISKVKVL